MINPNDRWFTPHDVCERIVALALRRYPGATFIEPCAGDGRIARLLPPGSLALDLEPAGAGVRRCDLFKLPADLPRPFVVVTNLPFSITVPALNALFAQGASAAVVIVQASVAREGSQRRLRGFGLVHEERLDCDFQSPDGRVLRGRNVHTDVHVYEADAPPMRFSDPPQLLEFVPHGTPGAVYVQSHGENAGRVLDRPMRNSFAVREIVPGTLDALRRAWQTDHTGSWRWSRATGVRYLDQRSLLRFAAAASPS